MGAAAEGFLPSPHPQGRWVDGRAPGECPSRAEGPPSLSPLHPHCLPFPQQLLGGLGGHTHPSAS